MALGILLGREKYKQENSCFNKENEWMLEFAVGGMSG